MFKQYIVYGTNRIQQMLMRGRYFSFEYSLLFSNTLHSFTYRYNDPISIFVSEFPPEPMKVICCPQVVHSDIWAQAFWVQKDRLSSSVSEVIPWIFVSGHDVCLGT